MTRGKAAMGNYEQPVVIGWWAVYANHGVGQAAAGWRRFAELSRGKSGLHRAGCQVTPGGREPTESAAESRPPKARRYGDANGKGERVR